MALAVNEAFEDIDMEEGGLRFSLGSIAAMTTDYWMEQASERS